MAIWQKVRPYLLVPEEYKKNVHNLLQRKKERAAEKRPPEERYRGWGEEAGAIIQSIHAHAHGSLHPLSSHFLQMQTAAFLAGALDAGAGSLSLSKQKRNGKSDDHIPRLRVYTPHKEVIEGIQKGASMLLNRKDTFGAVTAPSTEGGVYTLTFSSHAVSSLAKEISYYTASNTVREITAVFGQMKEGAIDRQQAYEQMKKLNT
jgi:hypothetical protein